ncbi:GNAT family N-acetyltransferase [Kushneria aurantia]|uniref:GNAT family N-acetyltransferase n=1 Tax=Kushneria aurantia TaxID=504092 RepID=A0ABV6FZ74_9GAMM
MRISQENSQVFVADISGELVGFIQLYPTFSTVDLSRIWILNDWYVLKRFRSQNVGYELLRAAKEFSERSGASQLRIETGLDNIKAQRLYGKFGFIESNGCKYYHFPLND